MTNPWRLTTIALVAMLGTALTSALATAYLLRATAPAASLDLAPSVTRTAAAEPVTTPPRRPPIVRIARTAHAAPMAQAADATPAERAEPVMAPAPEPTATVSGGERVIGEGPAGAAREPEAPVGAASPARTGSVPDDCATGGDRAWRIAKPGAMGTLVGAGVGAASGAIADGGSGAGKGALWGGLAGAALGSAWGAYRTHEECGTIFGSTAAR